MGKDSQNILMRKREDGILRWIYSGLSRSDVGYKKWETENNTVMTWLINSVAVELAAKYIFETVVRSGQK